LIRTHSRQPVNACHLCISAVTGVRAWGTGARRAGAAATMGISRAKGRAPPVTDPAQVAEIVAKFRA
jgi:hypothetical protein